MQEANREADAIIGRVLLAAFAEFDKAKSEGRLRDCVMIHLLKVPGARVEYIEFDIDGRCNLRPGNLYTAMLARGVLIDPAATLYRAPEGIYSVRDGELFLVPYRPVEFIELNMTVGEPT